MPPVLDDIGYRLFERQVGGRLDIERQAVPGGEGDDLVAETGNLGERTLQGQANLIDDAWFHVSHSTPSGPARLELPPITVPEDASAPGIRGHPAGRPAAVRTLFARAILSRAIL